MRPYPRFQYYPRYQFIKTDWFRAVAMFFVALVLAIVVFRPFSFKISAPTPTPTPTPPAEFPREDDPGKLLLENSIGRQWRIGEYDISPAGGKIAFSAFKNPGTLSLFIYSIDTKTSRAVYTTDAANITAKLGFTDNYQIKYSPAGEYWFFNQTAYPMVKLMVFSAAGQVAYLGQNDPGQPVWLNRYQLLFISGSDTQNASILDVYNNRIDKTSIPANFVHPRLSLGWKYFAAFEKDSPSKPSECGELVLVIYDFTTGKLVKRIPDVYLNSVAWIKLGSLRYQTMTQCPSSLSAPLTLSLPE